MVFNLFGPNIKKMREMKDVKGLIDVLKNTGSDKTIRNVGIALTQIGDQSIKPLVETIKDMVEKKDNVRALKMSAILFFLPFGLGATGIEEFIRILKNKTEYQVIRGSVARGLCFRAEERFVDPLIQILKDKDDDSGVRGRVAEALAIMQEPSLRVELVAGLFQKCDDRELSDKIGKLHIFGGSEKIINALRETLNDDNSFVRSSAAAALGKVSNDRG